MAKFSKHLQNKKKIREKKRAKKLRSLEAVTADQQRKKSVTANTGTPATVFDGSRIAKAKKRRRHDTASAANLKFRARDPVAVQSIAVVDGGCAEPRSTAPISVEEEKKIQNKKKSTRSLVPKKNGSASSIECADLPVKASVAKVVVTESSRTAEIAKEDDSIVRPRKNRNKRWSKLKAELRDKRLLKKTRHQLERNDKGGGAAAAAAAAADSLRQSGSASLAVAAREGADGMSDEADFKSMLLSKANVVSHRLERKREWRRQMKQLQRLKVKWGKEGKSNIEELVAEWRKRHARPTTPGRVPGALAAQECDAGNDVANVADANRPAGTADSDGGRHEDSSSPVTSTHDPASASKENLSFSSGRPITIQHQQKHQKQQPTTLASVDKTNKALQRLRVAQFRIINETLYTSSSDDAEKLFKNDTSAFNIYHEGYRSQVCKWPINPVDRLITELRRNLPRGTSVADLGCGEAKVAQVLKPLGYKVHSFDLVALNEHVVASNMKELPLPDGEIDVAVLCLSLMGTDMGTCVLEANRILKLGGLLKVAEVESRIPSTDGFVKIMKRYGFDLERQDTSHNIFAFFDFTKAKSVPKGAENNMDKPLRLKPCLYKKR